MKTIAETDLILNADGSVYHLNLLPEDLAPTVITVGDPDRVGEVSKHFDRLELKKGKREFITHTGYVGQKRISVISTGIGTDNIDIVLNELDALANIDFATRKVRADLTSLEIIRIGTSGSIQADIHIDSILVSEYALGLDALMAYYQYPYLPQEQVLLQAMQYQMEALNNLKPYLASADEGLIKRIGKGLKKGITITAPGFYAPQGRELRYQHAVPGLIAQLNSFSHDTYQITNLEMETAGIYALAKVLGHRALSVNAILASRVKFEFSKNPQKIVDQAIELVLERI
ncbi:MAG: nucleoside phosphorylase [Sphingobacteriaceae bacterium]